jgi:hypothetical protein
MQNDLVYNGSRGFNGEELTGRINQLIRVMSEIQTNLPPNLCNLIHRGLTAEARRVMCSIGKFKWSF